MCSEESEVELRHTSIDLFLWCSIKRSVVKIFSVLVLFLKSHVIHKTEKILTTNLLILKSDLSLVKFICSFHVLLYGQLMFVSLKTMLGF